RQLRTGSPQSHYTTIRRLIMNAKHLVKITLVALLTSVAFTLSHGTAQAVSCGDTLGPGGTFTLTTNLNCSIPGNYALHIVGPVTVDLKGHTLTCANTNTFGIHVTGNTATVKNGTITGCGHGVVLDSSKDKLSYLIVQGYNYDGFII